MDLGKSFILKSIASVVLLTINDSFVPIYFGASMDNSLDDANGTSKFFRTTGADIIGMTLVPECQLAREAQICYMSISTVTDYDVWAEKPVTAKEVMETLSKNVEATKTILIKLIDKIPENKSCSCEKALEEAEF